MRDAVEGNLNLDFRGPRWGRFLNLWVARELD